MMIYLSMIESPVNRSKFEIIYNTYKNLMFYVANQILGDSKDSEDVVHDAFVKVIEIINNIENPLCPKTKALIVTITENKAIDLYRRRQRKSVIHFDDAYTPAPSLGDTEAILDKELVAKAIAQLPAKYRAVLLLKFDQGFSTKEISNMLSMSPENVKKTIQRARKQLEQLLTDGGGF